MVDDSVSPVAGRVPWTKKRKAGVWLICGGAVVGLIWLTSQPRAPVEQGRGATAADKVGEVGDSWSPIPREQAPKEQVQNIGLTIPPAPRTQSPFPGFNGPAPITPRIPIVAFQAGGTSSPAPAKPGAAQAEAATAGDPLTSRLSAGGDMETSVATMLPDRNLFITMGTPMGCTPESPINTDQPGPFRCKVRIPVYSTSGNVPLLDTGTKIFGSVSQPLNRGNKRAFAVMHRIETPQGCLIRLRAPVADAMGEAGLDGEIDTHFWERFKGYAMIALLDTVSQAAALSASQALASKNGNSVSFNQFQGIGGQAGQQTFSDDANIPTTLRRKQAQPILIMAMQDLDFRPCFTLRPR